MLPNIFISRFFHISIELICEQKKKLKKEKSDDSSKASAKSKKNTKRKW